MTNENVNVSVNEATSSPSGSEQEPQVMSFIEALQTYTNTKPATTHWVRDEDGRKRKFAGWVIGDYDTQWLNGREQTRWTTWYLYVRENKTFVLETIYETCWQGESDSYSYEIYKTWEEVLQKAPPGLITDVRKFLEKELRVKIPIEEEAVPL